MKWLMPIGVALIVVGGAGSAAACFGVGLENGETETMAARMNDVTDAPAQETDDDASSRLVMAPLSGLALAIGLMCVAVGMGNWRRPKPSEIRPANPWSDQPAGHGDPPKGLV